MSYKKTGSRWSQSWGACGASSAQGHRERAESLPVPACPFSHSFFEAQLAYNVQVHGWRARTPQPLPRQPSAWRSASCPLPPTCLVLYEVFEAVRGKITLLRIKSWAERYLICSSRFCFFLEDYSRNSVMIWEYRLLYRL